MRPLSDRAFNQRLDDLLARLDRLGRTQTEDRGARRLLRAVKVTITVPGQIGAPSLPDEVRFEYEEWWRRSRLGWVRVRYNYNAFDLARGGHWGFHLHPLDRRRGEPVPHSVCVQADGSGVGRHFAAYEVDLLAAHEAFERWYAGGSPVDCEGLTPLD
jgi:hypothetical protein